MSGNKISLWFGGCDWWWSAALGSFTGRGEEAIIRHIPAIPGKHWKDEWFTGWLPQYEYYGYGDLLKSDMLKDISNPRLGSFRIDWTISTIANHKQTPLWIPRYFSLSLSLPLPLYLAITVALKKASWPARRDKMKGTPIERMRLIAESLLMIFGCRCCRSPNDIINPWNMLPFPAASRQ